MLRAITVLFGNLVVLFRERRFEAVPVTTAAGIKHTDIMIIIPNTGNHCQQQNQRQYRNSRALSPVH
jgi:hypothetical protein